MFDNLVNSISDKYTRDNNISANVYYKDDLGVKDTYIVDDELPNSTISPSYHQHMKDNMKQNDQRLSSYKVDDRILNIGRAAEDRYYQRKMTDERFYEEGLRKQHLQKSHDELLSEKAKLQQQINQSLAPTVQSNKSGLELLQESYKKPSAQLGQANHGINYEPNKKSVRFSDIKYKEQPVIDDTPRYDEPIGLSIADKIKNMSTAKENQSQLHQTTMGSSGFHVHHLPHQVDSHQNQDFNINNLPKMSKSPLEISMKKSEMLSTNDFEKMKQASKHCGACEAKYKQTLNEINPKMAKDKISDDYIRKVLIQLKTLFLAKKYDTGLDLVLKTIEDGYSHADLYYMSGEIRRALGNLKEAELEFLQTLTFEVHSPYVYHSLGIIYVQFEDYKRAIPLLKHFVEMIVSDTACFELGKCLAICKSYLEATIYFTKSIDINPKIADYYLHRGDSYEALGFMKLAIDDFAMYRKLNPNFEQIFEENIARLELQGRHVDANNLKSYLKKLRV